MHELITQGRTIAYFSMEIALESHIPTYSGGLGVLAGDTVRSAADLGIPFIGVTLASRAGYFRQEIDAGRQLEHPATWQPHEFARPLTPRVTVHVDGRDVQVAAWEYKVPACHGEASKATVLLLDTDLPGNHADDRRLTDNLYGGDERYRLAQEIVLGIGGARMLEALDVRVHKYHLNEGHAAFLTLELLRRHGGNAEAVAAVQKQCVFTTHTPVPAGHDQFEYDLAMKYLGTIADLRMLRKLAGEERLNMTYLALSLSGWVNGVAKRHAEVSRTMFPGYEVHAVTNGVHPGTWASDAFHALFDRHIPYWCHEPELLLQCDRVPLGEIRQAHATSRQALLAYIERVAPAAGFEPGRCTLGFARRMTRYKRAHLLFSDLERLKEIGRRFPMQIVVSGKAHPRDLEGKEQIAKIHAWARELKGIIPVVFLPGYDMQLGRMLVSGVDVWVNTPQRPLEASGTSGMKAALNGVPSLSILDGWWLEGCYEGETGWAIGKDGPHDDDADDAASLYEKLEGTVLPLFHTGGDAWTVLMRHTIARNGSFFNSHRMLRRYVLEAYAA